MLRKFYLSVAFSLFVVSLFLGLDRAFHRPSSSFALDHITTSNLFSSERGTPILSEQEKQQLRQILNQKFILYDRGARSYVCMSEDGQYILKFVKHQQLYAKSWLAHFTFPFNPYYQRFLLRKKRSAAILEAWKTAFSELKQETGLIYMHTDNAQTLHQKVIVLDNNVREHEINLDKTVFCVQRHAQLLYLRIADLMYRREAQKAKQIISSVFSLIERLGKAGVIDENFVLECNFGLVEDKAIQLDLGRLRADPALKNSQAYKTKIAMITQPFKDWLEKTYPELSTYFDTCLEEALKKSD